MSVSQKVTTWGKKQLTFSMKTCKMQIAMLTPHQHAEKAPLVTPLIVLGLLLSPSGTHALAFL